MQNDQLTIQAEKKEKDNAKQTALLEQTISFARKSETESHQRETECRKALESVQKDFDNQLKALQERRELDKSNLIKQVMAVCFRVLEFRVQYQLLVKSMLINRN